MIAIGGASAALLTRYVWRHRHENRRARALTMSPTGLGVFAKDLRNSILMRILDGTHERGVLGDVVYEPEGPRRRLVFTVEGHRDLRGEWGYLDVDPAFRLASPLTCLAVECRSSLGTLLLKRRGRSERVKDEPFEAVRTLAHAARDASAIDRQMVVAAPEDLPTSGVKLAIGGGEFLLWSAASAAVERAVKAEAEQALSEPVTLSREIVFELSGNTLLGYVALDGILDDRTTAALLAVMTELAKALEEKP